MVVSRKETRLQVFKVDYEFSSGKEVTPDYAGSHLPNIVPATLSGLSTTTADKDNIRLDSQFRTWTLPFAQLDTYENAAV